MVVKFFLPSSELGKVRVPCREVSFLKTFSRTVFKTPITFFQGFYRVLPVLENDFWTPPPPPINFVHDSVLHKRLVYIYG